MPWCFVNNQCSRHHTIRPHRGRATDSCHFHRNCLSTARRRACWRRGRIHASLKEGSKTDVLNGLGEEQFPFAAPKRPKFQAFVGQTEGARLLKAFRHKCEVEGGFLLLRPLEQDSLSAATELLTEAFAEAVGYMRPYRGFLKQQVREYLYSHIGFAPKALILEALLIKPGCQDDVIPPDESSQALIIRKTENAVSWLDEDTYMGHVADDGGEAQYSPTPPKSDPLLKASPPQTASSSTSNGSMLEVPSDAETDADTETDAETDAEASASDSSSADGPSNTGTDAEASNGSSAGFSGGHVSGSAQELPAPKDGDLCEYPSDAETDAEASPSNSSLADGPSDIGTDAEASNGSSAGHSGGDVSGSTEKVPAPKDGEERNLLMGGADEGRTKMVSERELEGVMAEGLADGVEQSTANELADTEGSLQGEEERTRGQVVGTVELSFASSTRTRGLTLNPPADGAYLCNMAVGVKFQRRGYARAMLAAAEDVVQLAGFRRVWLHVRLKDQAARALYERAGFEVEEEDCCLVGLWDNRRRLLSKFFPKRKAPLELAQPLQGDLEEEIVVSEF